MLKICADEFDKLRPYSYRPIYADQKTIEFSDKVPTIQNYKQIIRNQKSYVVFWFTVLHCSSHALEFRV